MEKFILLIREDLEAAGQMSADNLEREIALMSKWVEEIALTGNFVGGEPLQPEGALLRGEQVLLNGHFMELKEGVSGYVIIQANNFEQAIQLAQTCPHLKGGGTIELRPIIDLSGT